jgi:hypothetical protein
VDGELSERGVLRMAGMSMDDGSVRVRVALIVIVRVGLRLRDCAIVRLGVDSGRLLARRKG